VVKIVQLAPGLEPPTDGDCWICVEADSNGSFYGTGCGRGDDGQTVFYVSLPENDVSLEAAVAAAAEWAERRGVEVVHVQPVPPGAERDVPPQ
jgi:hypothetical protein